MGYLWPTTRGWMALFAAAASFCLALTNSSLIAGIVTAGIWVLISASFATSVFVMSGVRLRRAHGEGGTARRRLIMPVHLYNNSRWHRQPMVIREICPFADPALQETIVPAMAPHTDVVVQRPIFAARRGEFHLDQITLRSGDPAGLFYRQKTFSFPQRMIIEPERVRLTWLPLKLRDRVVPSPVGQALGMSGIGQEFFGVREYRPTDGIRFIHWKASARQQRMMVREFEETTINQVTILLDTNRDHLADTVDDNFEFLITTAASICSYLSGMYCRVLFDAGDTHYEGRCNGDAQTVVRQMLYQLTVLEADECDFVSLLSRNLPRLPPRSILYCLTMSEQPSLAGHLLTMADRGIDVRWIHAPPELFDRSPRQLDSYDATTGPMHPILAHREISIPRILTYGE